MSRSYLLVSVGPVQRSISQARRTQDLFTGSRLLSLLAETGLEIITHWPNTDIIYPQVGAHRASVPNRLLAKSDTADAEALATAVTQGITERWLRITDEVLHRFEESTGTGVNREIWDRQVANWLEVYAITTLVTGDYQADHAEANRRMAARKMVRSFVQQVEPGHKCSLTGEHEALHDRASGAASLEDVRRFWDGVRQSQNNLALINRGERLGALAVVKRLAHEAVPEFKPQGRFPSTSSIASAPFRAAIIEHWAEVKGAAENYLDELQAVFDTLGSTWKELYFTQEGHLNPERFAYFEDIEAGIDPTSDENLLTAFRSLDGDFLYPEGLQPSAIQEYARSDSAPSAKQLEHAQKALSALYERTARLDILRPSDYLAVISIDGDHMGRHTGDLTEETQHRDFSRDLAGFAANTVRRIVEKDNPGRVIYAGGDDVLAVLPAKYALHAADKLRREFAKQFPGLHCSAGIAYVHRRYSLQAAIYAAKAAQERAKNEYGRNAVAAALLQRSGEPLYMGLRWDAASPQNPQPALNVSQVMQAVAAAMAADQLAHGLPYDIEQVIYATSGLSVASRARQMEFKRVFRRRCKDGYDGEALADDLVRIGNDGIADASTPDAWIRGWEELARWLRLARFLAGQEDRRVALS